MATREHASVARISAKKKAGLQLRLYIAGNAPNSLRAITNLKTICDEHFASEYTLEIVDLLTHPDRGLADGIIVTPTLVKLSPLPVQKVIGTLNDTHHVAMALGSK
jgi:circadian clock protein KaiB